MANPAQQQKIDEAAGYVSPTSDETLQERYLRIQQEEAKMTPAEIQEKINQLKQASDLFDWESNQ